MARGHTRSAIVWWCCVFFAAIALFAAGGWILRGLDALSHRGRGYLGHQLRSRHDLLLYIPFEKPRPVNLATGCDLLRHNLGDGPGRYGTGCVVDDDKRTLFWTDSSLGALPDATGTLAFWWKPLSGPDGVENRIFWSHSKDSVLGIRLRQGRLEVVYTLSDYTRGVVGVPCDRSWEGYSHFALVLAGDALRLYVDGEVVLSRTFSNTLSPPHHFFGFGGDPRVPTHALYDDLALWKRALTATEIRGIARSPYPVSVRCEPVVVGCVRFLEFSRSFMSGAYRVFDRLVPHVTSPAVIRSEIPALELRLSKADSRHFRKAYEKTARRAERTRKATRFRTISAFYQGRSESIEACLDDLGMFETPSRRYSFELKAPPGFLAEGSGMVRLYPPERWEVFHPDALRPLPLDRRRFVRLYLQGDFQGFYLMEPMDRCGSAWLLAGRRQPARKDFIFFDSQPSLSLEEKKLSDEEVARRYREIGALLRSDVRFPWSAQELRFRERRFGKRRADLAFAAPALSANDLKGANPSDYYVVTNLDLSAYGENVIWHSSNPQVLSPDGIVRRPDGDIPLVVELRADSPNGKSRSFRFRVIPSHPRFQALHFHLSMPLEKMWDRDFTCRLFPAGGGKARWLTGTQGEGAGIHHRGNTSYVRAAKRSMSVEFDEPVDLGLTGRPNRHALLLSGYADATKIRNKLCFDTYQAMRATSVRRSPFVTWTEVFVNGEYAGMWEMASRLQDVAAPSFRRMFKVPTPNSLWYTAEPDFLTFVGTPPLPPGAFDDFVELSKFVTESDPKDFLGRFEEFFDKDALIDFFLLVNFTGNFDGRVTNQFICQRREDGKWECLPWDYDKTFMDKDGKDLWLYNPLFARLKNESPDFLHLAAKRWKHLRAGVLSDENLLGWFDRQAAFLSPCMDDELDLLQPMDTMGGYDEQTKALRAEILYRLRLLDGKFAL